MQKKWVMVFNGTFGGGKTGVPGENYQPAASH